MESIILFAHGARDPEWARPLQRLREAVLARSPGLDVRLAFLEFMSPDLGGAIDEAAAAGVREIRVIPVFLAQGGHVRRDVPVILEAARTRHPALPIHLQPVLGEAQAVIEAMAVTVLEPGQDCSRSG